MSKKTQQQIINDIASIVPNTAKTPQETMRQHKSATPGTQLQDMLGSNRLSEHEQIFENLKDDLSLSDPWTAHPLQDILQAAEDAALDLDNVSGVGVVSDFSHYATITVDADQVGGSSGTESGFPVLISGTYDSTGSEPDFRTTANGGNVTSDNGYDIYFYTDTGQGTQLPHEIVSYNASTGAYIAWVKVDLTKGSDTTFYVFYGNSNITTDPSSTDTWGTEFDLVMHLDEAVNTTAGGYVDSTSNSVDGTGVSMALTAPTAKVDKGQDFDGSADYIKFGSVLDKNPTDTFTLSAWVKSDVDSYVGRIIGKQESSGNFSGWGMNYDGNNNVISWGLVGDSTSVQARPDNATVTNGNWYHYTITYDGSTDGSGVTFYIAGSADTTDAYVDTLTSGDDTTNATELNIGARNNGNIPFNGVLDEVVLINEEKDADWALTWYNTQNAPSSFYSVGNETAV